MLNMLGSWSGHREKLGYSQLQRHLRHHWSWGEAQRLKCIFKIIPSWVSSFRSLYLHIDWSLKEPWLPGVWPWPPDLSIDEAIQVSVTMAPAYDQLVQQHWPLGNHIKPFPQPPFLPLPYPFTHCTCYYCINLLTNQIWWEPLGNRWKHISGVTQALWNSHLTTMYPGC